jgi:cobalt transporter subunit CbtB
MSVTTTTTQVVPIGAASRLPLAAAVFFLGAAFIFIAGFAQPELLHNAAHDMRHAMSFPCH